MTASQCNPSDDSNQGNQGSPENPESGNYLASLTAGTSPALLGLSEPHPLIPRLDHLLVTDPLAVRDAMSRLLTPLADSAHDLDPDGHRTVAALQIAAYYLSLKTREQRVRLFGTMLNAHHCERDQQHLHDWRRLEWAESIRYDLHGLTGEARVERLSHFASANHLPEAAVLAFAQIAASLDNIRTLDDCWMPQIP